MLKPNFMPLDVIFDIETAPDLATARRVYPELAKHKTDAACLKALYKIAGATAEQPEPFLKYFLHKVVSVVGITRKQVKPCEANPAGVELNFFSLPGVDLGLTEAEIVGRFLTRVGTAKPRLVGWSSSMFDLPVLTQRAIINGIALPDFCRRPDKPWEGADYFAPNGSEHNIDLLQIVSSKSGNSKAKLNEFARALRIPGKMGVEGSDVAAMALGGNLAEIVAYNECDAATTYLVWLAVLRTTGQVDENAYILEKIAFRSLLNRRIADGADHFTKFLAEWSALEQA